MPSFGGLAPFPFRFGGGKPALKSHVDSILAQLGTAFDTTDTNGLVYVRAQAYGRVFWALWEHNQRMAYQWDPVRMSDFLPRWEAILQLAVSPTDSLAVRRARVGVRRALAGYARESDLYSACLAFLGASVFVGIVNTPSASAQVWTPAGWPMGNHPSLPHDPDWFSSVSHVVIMTTQPATMTDSEYYTLRSSVKPLLDAILPAWVTFDVARDGPGGAIFRLDDAHNLDNERFGS